MGGRLWGGWVLCVVMVFVTGCATVEPDPCAPRVRSNAGNRYVIVDYLLEIPFTFHVIDGETGEPLGGATVYNGDYGLEPPDWPELVLGTTESDGAVAGLARTVTSSRNPYTPCNQQRFRGIPVLIRHSGYTPHLFFVTLPDAAGQTIDMGAVYLNPAD